MVLTSSGRWELECYDILFNTLTVQSTALHDLAWYALSNLACLHTWHSSVEFWIYYRLPWFISWIFNLWKKLTKLTLAHLAHTCLISFITFAQSFLSQFSSVHPPAWMNDSMHRWMGFSRSSRDFSENMIFSSKSNPSLASKKSTDLVRQCFLQSNRTFRWTSSEEEVELIMMTRIRTIIRGWRPFGGNPYLAARLLLCRWGSCPCFLRTGNTSWFCLKQEMSER